MGLCLGLWVPERACVTVGDRDDCNYHNIGVMTIIEELVHRCDVWQLVQLQVASHLREGKQTCDVITPYTHMDEPNHAAIAKP